MSLPPPDETLDGTPPPLVALAELLAAFPRAWFLCGGWAVDAWLGRQTRAHADIDLAVFAHDLDAVQDHFAGWQLLGHDDLTPDSEDQWDGRALVLPAHVHARGEGFDLDIQVGALSGGNLVLNEAPFVARDLAACTGECPWGLPALLPEVLLYYKARELRDRDEADFRALLPHLDEGQIDWLREVIARLEPQHSWLAALSR